MGNVLERRLNKKPQPTWAVSLIFCFPPLVLCPVLSPSVILVFVLLSWLHQGLKVMLILPWACALFLIFN